MGRFFFGYRSPLIQNADGTWAIPSYPVITWVYPAYNVSFRLKYVLKIWKIAEIIISKPGKSPNGVSFYNLFAAGNFKTICKVTCDRLKSIIEVKHMSPDFQVGFRERHSSQVHGITDIIDKSLEERKVYSTVYLDVAQAFDNKFRKCIDH